MVPSLSLDFKYLSLMAKNKKHNSLVKDYDKQKSEHLDKLATKMLKNDDKTQKLKEKIINTNFLKLF